MHKTKLKRKTYFKKNIWQFWINHQLKQEIAKNPNLKYFLHYRYFSAFIIYNGKKWCQFHYAYHRHAETINKLKNWI